MPPLHSARSDRARPHGVPDVLPAIRPRSQALLALTAVLALVVSVLAAFAVSGADRATAGDAAAPPVDPALRTLFPRTAPHRVAVRHADGPVEVGTRFLAKRRGWVYGVRFWKDASSSGRHVGALWTSTGQQLATGRYRGGSASGWQRLTFDKPVRIKARTTYVVTTRSSDGTYVSVPHYQRAPRSSVLRFVGARSATVRPLAEAKDPGPWRRGATYVDVLFAPVPGVQPTASATPTPIPTATPAPTPTGSASPAPNALCKPVPSACGYPDVTNTGPAPGTTFTRVPSQVTSGPGWAWNATYSTIFVSGTNAVLDGLDVAGGVVIDAPGVIVRNSRIASCGGTDDSDVVAIRYQPGNASYNGANAQVVANDINGSPAGCSHRARSGVRDVFGEAPGVLVDGNNIYGTGNGVTIEHEGVVSDNWVHDLGHLAGDHHSGLSTHGGAVNVTFVHNTVLLYGMPTPGGGGVSGAITVYADFGHAQNTTIQDNFVSGGGYVVYGGNSGDAYSTPATGIKVRGNRFACGDWLYGPVTAFLRTSPGNEWTGNYCDGSGSAVNP